MNQPELFITMALSAWESHINRVNKLLEQLSEAQLRSETAKDRNTGIYLLGHLTAVHDALLPLLGLGERMYPQLDVAFVHTPDKSNQQMPSIEILKQCWNNTNTTLLEKMRMLSADEWFSRHTAITEEAFVKEPHRNKLNVVLNRTNHLSYHLGQLTYLLKK